MAQDGCRDCSRLRGEISSLAVGPAHRRCKIHLGSLAEADSLVQKLLNCQTSELLNLYCFIIYSFIHLNWFIKNARG